MSRQHLRLFLHLHTGETIVGDIHMRFRKREPLLSVLLDTGLHLLDFVRERLPDNMDDVRNRVRDTYGTASERVGRATDALRGQEDAHIFGKVGVLLLGVGVGVGIGLLIAPASGEETRADITAKVSDLGDKVRERTGKKPQAATGTYGE
jgi:YtxH-like protein